ncbi:hypothetical protein [Plantactinospora alkalitolerans]|uniref:hypothetical protein n=1 Tax=Plantactinospora alkalitolerans TaxID=2789879 RepID=UPI001E582481|nr:hypothetical protein [Plantactinospora alkalitolerans]
MGQSVRGRGHSGRGRWALACSGGLAAVLLLGGCTGERDNPGRTPSASATGSAPSASTGAAPDGSGSTYDAVGLDLCAGTDLAPLADLSLRVEKKNAQAPRSAPGSACQFNLRTRSGHEATLLVEASTLTSAEEAGRLYKATRDVTAMRPDGAVGGIGDEAEGFSEESDPGFKYSEYMIHARSGNLVLKVWLAVGGTAFTPKDVLAEKTTAITGATLAQVPR